MSNEYYKAYVQYEYFTRGEIYEDNPDCVKSMLNSRYWKLNKKSDSESKSSYLIIVEVILGVIFGILIIVTVVIIVRCIKKRKQEETPADSESVLTINAG